MPKLNWKVAKGKDGKFVRRQNPDDLFNLDAIDVEWTHDDGFPEDTIEVPTSHPPGPAGVPTEQTYETRKVGKRDVILDQLLIPPQAQDSTIMTMLDEKRKTLAKALGVSE
jgi:hypothetical protein